MKRLTFFGVVLFLLQVGMMAAIITDNVYVRGITMILLFPIVFIASIFRDEGGGKETEFVLSPEALFIVVQGLVWDNATQEGGPWVYAFWGSIPIVCLLSAFCLYVKSREQS